MTRRVSKHIPDKWLDYYPIKEAIGDIKVIPFKVPLPLRRFDDDYMRSHKWTPSDVINHVPNLGLVIDLTFKTPSYYDTDEFLKNGVDYIKIGCPGHNIPPEGTFHKFCEVVDNFLQQHPDLVVGVHCTHGVNRTGYMICRYMVERRGYTSRDALETFANKRGYRIERDNYIEKINSSERA